MPFRSDPDEDPSEEDQERFGDDRVSTGYCPDCGGQVFDDAEVCPKCFAFISGQVKAQRPRRKGLFHEQWMVVLIVALIIGLTMCSLGYLWVRLART